jgi:3-hydroxyisobutyrate dehydrogenase-like beta-hydroxyacid dehydrogenase
MESRFKKPVVGFIGLGRMGGAMAKNILKNGYPLVVWNRHHEKLAEHEMLGAKIASTPKDMAKKCDVIVSMLATPAATETVVLGTEEWQGVGVVDGIQPGKIVVDMSTNLPSEIRRLAHNIEKKESEFIDAPVLGSVGPAVEGSLTFLAGGKKEAVEKVRPILETMGKKIWYIGSTGMGCAMKLTMNLHLNIITGAFAESLAFGTKAGLDPSLIVEIWNSSIFKTYVTETKGKKVLDGDWTPAFTIELALKDVQLASELAREMNAPVLLGSIVKQLYIAAVANGRKDSDFCALATVYEQILPCESVQTIS